MRPLADGSTAVALLDRSDAATTVTAADLPVAPGAAVLDVWAGSTTTATGAPLSARVPPHGVVLYRVRPVTPP